MSLSLERPLVFFDLETTGINIAKDDIVELCLARLNPGNTSPEVKVYRFKPRIPIPPAATAIHGISNADVANSPRLEDHAGEIISYFMDADIGGFNVQRFDLPFLAQKLADRGFRFDFTRAHVVDPMIVFHKKEERTLKAAYQFYCGKTLENAHSAEADTLAALEILQAQIHKYGDIGSTAAEIADWCNAGRRKADADGKLRIDDDGELVYAFGKYNGKKVKDELDYAAWALTGDFSEEVKMLLRKVIEEN